MKNREVHAVLGERGCNASATPPISEPRHGIRARTSIGSYLSFYIGKASSSLTGNAGSVYFNRPLLAAAALMTDGPMVARARRKGDRNGCDMSFACRKAWTTHRLPHMHGRKQKTPREHKFKKTHGRSRI